MQNRGRFTFEITTTALCDLGCTYCFEGEKVNKQRLDKDLNIIINKLESLLEYDWFIENYNELAISFWGGEPTLNPEFIVQIINRLFQKENVSFHIYSNGYNLKNIKYIIENIEDYKSKRLFIQISYDGRLITDEYRLSKNGKPTSGVILNSIKYLVEAGVNTTIKSTVPINSINKLFDSWLEFKEIYNFCLNNQENVTISFAPTIDYVTEISDEERNKSIEIFKEQMLKIAKEEYFFFKKHKRYLCTWFGASDQRNTCSAGRNMLALDVNGDLYVCHGALYSPKKNEVKNSNIYDENFLENLKNFTNTYDEIINKIDNECSKCIATTCMICPVQSHVKSNKTDFAEKWLDNGINKLCGFYKTFGPIDRAIQHKILKEKIDGM